MTLAIETPAAAAPLTLEAASDALAAMRFDGKDEEAFRAAAPILAGLAADRRFLAHC